MSSNQTIQWHTDAKNVNGGSCWQLQRRGYDLGAVQLQPAVVNLPDTDAVVAQWRQDKPVFLPALIADILPAQQKNLDASEQLLTDILEGDMPSLHVDSGEYAERLQPRFAMVACSEEYQDAQAVEKLFFDDDGADLVLENLWCKVSWLSFYDDDASMRFRFSFGMEGFEDVAADPVRQQSAADLCTAIFPESAALEQHSKVNVFIKEIIGQPASYVERIVYFNAPDGGAQMHHDVEPGHAGVIYAQMNGRTFWLALAKPLLMQEIRNYYALHQQQVLALFPAQDQRDALQQLLTDEAALSAHLDEADHELMETVMDRHPGFIQYMIEQGHGFILEAGDVILLPQRDLATCVWHTVFCLGDEVGEALSFAIRAKA